VILANSLACLTDEKSWASVKSLLIVVHCGTLSKKLMLGVYWNLGLRTPRVFDVILVTPERVFVSQHRPDAEGLISILKCLKPKSYVLSLLRRVLVELPRPSALRKRLMYFPFEIIIWDTKVFYNIGPWE
jgi:hypothetical protein